MKNFLYHTSQALFSFLLTFVFANCHSSKSAAGNTTPDQTFTFFVLGDWGLKGKGNQLPVANEMIRQSKLHEPSLIMTVGDNFYENGVSSIDDEHWKLSYEDVYKDMTKKYPWYVALGNHDYRGNVEAQIGYHSINPNWNMPARYYTFVKTLPSNEKVRFLVIDTDPYILSYYSDLNYKKVIAEQDTAKQTRWIDSVLAASKEEWKIVAGHHPLYSADDKRPDTSNLVRVMEPLFKRYKVKAYICGHVHDIQYNYPGNGNTGYIISGSGAKTIKPVSNADFTLFSSTAPCFTVCSIERDQMTFKFIDTTGKAVYQNVIKK